MSGKRKMEVFFDYSCPYCLKGHEYLEALYKQFADIEIVWCPCEAHPRPEPGPHSDLALQGLFYAIENGADVWEFHKRMYHALLKDRIDKENVDVLAECVKDIVDVADFKQAIISGKYADVQQGMNDHAYEVSGVWAIPSYRMDGEKLDSVAGIGVTKEQLREFMAQG